MRALQLSSLGRRAAGPLGRWAAGPLGRWAAGPLGRWAAGPLGPLGQRAISTSLSPSLARGETPQALRKRRVIGALLGREASHRGRPDRRAHPDPGPEPARVRRGGRRTRGRLGRSTAYDRRQRKWRLILPRGWTCRGVPAPPSNQRWMMTSAPRGRISNSSFTSSLRIRMQPRLTSPPTPLGSEVP